MATDATSYTLTIDTIAGNGVLGLQLPANVYADTVGNDGLAYEVSNLLRIDTSAPRVVSVAPQIDALPSSRSVVFNVTYSEAVFNVDTTDFVLIATESASGRISAVSDTSSSTYQVTVTDIDGAGSLRVDVLTDSYSDKAGNQGLGFMDGMSHTVGRVPPELVALTARGSTLTSGAAVVFDVYFSKAVTGLDATDFVLVADDTATATLSLRGK